MVVRCRVRHYWSQVNNKELFKLLTDGSLQHIDPVANVPVDENFNYFTVDAGFNWEFAPGSFINLVWKNNAQEFLTDPFDAPFSDNYFKNFDRTMKIPQNNNFSIKVIYFLDYLQLKNWKKKKPESK
jgi:hypothetical protein